MKFCYKITLLSIMKPDNIKQKPQDLYWIVILPEGQQVL